MTRGDFDRLRALFSATLPYSTDLQSVHYSILGFSLLDESIPEPQVVMATCHEDNFELNGSTSFQITQLNSCFQKACDTVKANVQADNVESIFYASSVANTLKTKGKVTCSVSTSEVIEFDLGVWERKVISFSVILQLGLKDAQTVLTNAIKDDASTATIYHAVAALINLGLKGN